MATDPLTGEDDGDEVTPPKTWRERPANWPRKIPYNGIHPNRDRYPEIREDPAFTHLLKPSRDPKRKGALVFPAGMAPGQWHPDYRPANVGKVRENLAEQKTRPPSINDGPGDEEEREQSYRALSRAYASVPEATLRKIVKRIAEQAASGDDKAQALFVRLESLLARSPVDANEGGVVKPDVVAHAERALDDLVRKIGAVYPDHACPWCGQDVPERD